ncbi:CBM96 family carbohydrate-binding protein [Gracilibacillus timonensis]|uniref:CBM96 family carbohydrate-binding protein n=1 Tax=Gracilibacillus timonensis TaxID=1816696 RepID=UPI000826B7B0|nr:DNRLRE domain-containing protein [Gracilibacillus timonensis]
MSKRRIRTNIIVISCAIILLIGIMPLPSASTILHGETVSDVSNVDTSSDKEVMKVGGEPFFYNGVQIRYDNILNETDYTDEQFEDIYQQAADDGFTVVNSQLLWSMVQPDQVYTANESTYISGGANANTNFSSSDSMKVENDTSDQSEQALSYFKFDFSDISGSDADAAKIRIYVNDMDNGTADLHLYGVSDDSWDASTMTWNNSSSFHDGYDLEGTEGSDYFDIGGTATYDPVNKVAAYDFDVTDFLNSHAYTDGKQASFVLKVDNNVDVSIDGVTGTTLAPKLVISREDVYDWSKVDKLIEWASEADIKLELMWFGSNTSKRTVDFRVPYYVLRNYQKAESSTGEVLRNKSSNVSLDKVVYEFVMSQNDPNLRQQEYAVLKTLFDHVADYNYQHGDEKTVVGVQLNNEPGGEIHGGRSYDPYAEEQYDAGGYSSENRFIYDTFYIWAQNLGDAVKESDYPVWTRMNFHSSQFYFLYKNEEARADGETTSIDFVGYDPYIHTTDEAIRFGQGLWDDKQYYPYNYGHNLPMIMETNGENTNSDYLDISTIAGGAVYNIYQYLSRDNYMGLYKYGEDGPEVSNSNIEHIRKTNLWLQQLWYDLATKQPGAAGGTELKFFNELAKDSTTVTQKIRGIDVVYTTDNKGVGIAVEKDDKTVALASKTASDFELKNLLLYGPVTMTKGYYDEHADWVSTSTKSFTTNGDDVVVDIDAYETVRIQVADSLPELTTNYSVNEEFNSLPSGWDYQGDVAIDNNPGKLDTSLKIEGAGSQFDYRDRGDPDDIRRDFIISSDYSFLVDVPNGQYDVTIIAGDNEAWNETSIAIEGVDEGAFHSDEGEFSENTFTTTINDGQLNLDLSDRVNGITVTETEENPSVDLKFDFGSDNSPVANGYTQVTRDLLYNGQTGYGLQTPSSNEAYTKHALSPLNGIVELESRVYKEDRDDWFGAPTVYDSSGNTVVEMAFDSSGNIVYKDSNKEWVTLQSYSSRTWFEINVSINTDTDTFDLYINDTKMLSQEPLATPITDIAEVKFFTDTSGVSYIDKVRVYQEFVE